MTTSPARRLVVLYATLSALLDLAVLLPGNPHYSSLWGLVGAVLFQALVVWRLWRASPLAWMIGLLSAVLTLGSLYLMAGPPEVGTILLTSFSLAQVGVLAAPPIAKSVWLRDHRPLSSNP
ncbi:MAG: hypothetical protein WBB76_12940 [Gaiellaceae bacterium]